MKNILALLVAVGALATFAAPQAEAGISCRPKVSYCQPYLVSTVEICRRDFCKTYRDQCGRCYTVHYTTVTYRNHYSNGSCHDFTRTYRV